MTTRRRAARDPGPDLRVGISGWNYPPWRGVFYPKGLPQRRELEYAARRFNSIEINGTFYSLQRPEYFQRWRDAAPPGFAFAVKGSRFITHMKKLRDVKVPLANFFASGPLALNQKLGPILWQFGPNWSYDARRFEAFLELLPRSTEAAARLTRRHDARVSGRSWMRTDADRPIRYAVEPRHPSFFTPACMEALRKHGVALVFADTAGKFPYAEDLTADFVYVRLHGVGELYVGGYDDHHLDHWASRARLWVRGAQPRDARMVAPPMAERPASRDLYVYFDNDAKVRAPFDAMRLAAQLGLPSHPDAEKDRMETPATPAARLSAREVKARRVEIGLRWKPVNR